MGRISAWPARLVCRALVLALVLGVGGVGVGPSDRSSFRNSADSRSSLRIRVLSTRADLVSGGDALVRIVLPPGRSAAGLEVRIGQRDLSHAFDVRSNGQIEGLVDGLRNGTNVLSARLPSGEGARITITNHPRGGPVFSGPQIEPWGCAEGARDKQCNRRTTYEFVCKSSATGQFQPYEPEDPPGDCATTTTDEGKTVPYIVRTETGVIDRDQYRIAVLYDPEKPWLPWEPQRAFNRKLVITHGASCNTEYQQAEAPDVMNDTALSRGFAVMSHALDNSGHNCNVALQAEALVMTKEHFIDNYGTVRYTIGTGCSGGALAQYQIANAYPGIYQGISPACSFMDTWTGRMLYEDYSLLRRYFENPASWAPGVAWTEDDVAATWGHPNHVNAVVYNSAISALLDPSRTCPGVADEDVYHPESNPRGVRCSLQDYMVNLFGRRPRSEWTKIEKKLGKGFADRPWDNEGVPYGYEALQAGIITPAQFVDVNAKVGGRDIDYEWQEKRARASRSALSIAHRSGAYNTASNLDQVAIIDLRGPDPGAFHDVYRTYAVRARLIREQGHADNQLLWRGSVALMGDPSFESDAILALDKWLTRVERDDRDISFARKIVEDRPKSVTHRCTDGAGEEMPEEYCNEVVQSYSTARIEAGMPFSDDVAKCHLKPLTPAHFFPVTFSNDQWEVLESTFRRGICDYSKPSVAFHETVPWMTYEGGPGGRPLGPEPTSRSFGS